MEITRKEPPRTFTIKGVTLAHVADVGLAPDEFVTFQTPEGSQYDVARKDWGFYATPSLNGSLFEKGFKSALAVNEFGRVYLLLVEKGHEDSFEKYMKEQSMTVVQWLHDIANADADKD